MTTSAIYTPSDLLQYILNSTRRANRPAVLSPRHIEAHASTAAKSGGMWPLHALAWRMAIDSDMIRCFNFRARSESTDKHHDLVVRLTEYALERLLPAEKSLSGSNIDCTAHLGGTRADMVRSSGGRQFTFPQLLLWVAAIANKTEAMLAALDATNSNAGRWRAAVQDLWHGVYGTQPPVMRAWRSMNWEAFHRVLEAECSVISPKNSAQGMLIFRAANDTSYLSANPTIYRAVIGSGVTLTTSAHEAARFGFMGTLGDYLDGQLERLNPELREYKAILRWKQALMAANLKPVRLATNEHMPSL